MRFRVYFRSVILAWRKFRETEPSHAAKIHDLVLRFAQEMTEADNRNQGIELLKNAPYYNELQSLLALYSQQLGLVGPSDQEVQTWIKIITFEEINREFAKAN